MMKQASLYSWIDQGGGKRRGVIDKNLASCARASELSFILSLPSPSSFFDVFEVPLEERQLDRDLMA
jgi:hypothetical protein